jgi:hypothetical protein
MTPRKHIACYLESKANFWKLFIVVINIRLNNTCKTALVIIIETST